MNKSQLIKWGFKLLCVIGITIVLCGNIVNAQDRAQSKPKVEVINDDNFKKKIAIIFGPEASGLTNNELSYANYVIKLPTNNKFQSLNLSHCVILLCHEIFKILNKKIKKFDSRYKNKQVNKEELNKFVNFLVNSLDQIGFLQPDHKRKSMIENIRTIFHKMNLSDKEMRILLGIFGSLKDKKVD